MARKAGVIGKNCAAAARGDGLVAIEAERAEQSKSARVPAMVITAKRFGRIFHQRQIEIVGNCQHAIKIHRMAKRVHGHQRTNYAPTAAVDTLPGLLRGVVV